MDIVIKACLGLAAAAVLILAVAVVWLATSPWPVVRLLRRGQDAPAEYLPDHGERAKRVRVVKDLSYPSQYGRNRLDLYLPLSAQARCPLILWVHGGAFVAGGKEGTENWAASLASEGVAVATMDYQWAPEAAWPAQVCQVGEVCRWLEEHAEEYGFDMGRVVIAGDSAGAHMAAQFALIHTSPEFRAQTGLAPVLGPGALQGALLYCGPYDIGQMAEIKSRAVQFFIGRIGWSYLGKKRWQGTETARLMTVKRFITPDFPPTYITDGNTFSFEPQGRALVEALRRTGCTVKSRFWDKSAGEVPHEYQFALTQPNAQACYQDTVSFLKELALLGGGANQ